LSQSTLVEWRTTGDVPSSMVVLAKAQWIELASLCISTEGAKRTYQID
jgi:hypothetical protein